MLSPKQKRILEKVEQREYFDRCLKSKVCPECGDDLRVAGVEKDKEIKVFKCYLCERTFTLIEGKYKNV